METRATCFGGVFLEGMLKEGFAVVWGVVLFQYAYDSLQRRCRGHHFEFFFVCLGEPYRRMDQEHFILAVDLLSIEQLLYWNLLRSRTYRRGDFVFGGRRRSLHNNGGKSCTGACLSCLLGLLA